MGSSGGNGGGSGGSGNRPSMPATVAVAALAAGLAFAVVYGMAGGGGNGPGSSQPTGIAEGAVNAAPVAGAQDKVSAAVGANEASKLAAFVKKSPAVDLANVSFVDGTGAAKTLADFKGKTVLLNLWATWCAPCREEMPSLDRLQKAMGSDTFEVVALAVDRTGAEAAAKFLKSINVENLKPYADPTTKSGNALRVLGMPTTILINAEGREAGRLAGPAHWDSDEAKALIKDAMK
jgi:thiol-disulfide isomerase/thioredoxin